METDIKLLDHSNNGLITKIWGKHLWEALHAISFGYPINPTDEQKLQYMQYFKDTAHVLPCIYCRKSYGGFITEGPTKLTIDTFKNRDSLTRWVYELHETVNAKLGVTYGVTYEDVVERYEAFRAKCVHNEKKGCVMPLDLKAQSYKKADERNAPLIKKDIVLQFANYAKIRGIDIHSILNIVNEKNEKTSNWHARNKICWSIIKKMRINGESSVEKSGKFEGLPTLNELKLISLLSTTISSCDFPPILEKLKEFTL